MPEPELCFKDLVTAAVACPTTSEAQGIVIEIGEEDYTFLIATYNDVELKKASKVAGIYWLVGDAHEKPIYKNAITQNLLFWLPGEQEGWYVSAEYVDNHKDMAKLNGAHVFAWIGRDEVPNTIHVPYWAKKPLKADGTGVKTVVNYHMNRTF